MSEEYLAGKTIVDGKLQEIWRRKESHNLGRDNGRNAHLWLRKTYNGQEFEWIPWIDIATKRPCFEVRIVEGNRTKPKWDETIITGTCLVEILCNKNKVYEFRCRDMGYALSKAQVLLIEMGEHPFDFENPERMIGRKLWYHGQPAVIESLMLDQGCVVFKPENGTFDLSEPWDKDDSWAQEDQEWVKDDIFSDKIWWFRE